MLRSLILRRRHCRFERRRFRADALAERRQVVIAALVIIRVAI